MWPNEQSVRLDWANITIYCHNTWIKFDIQSIIYGEMGRQSIYLLSHLNEMTISPSVFVAKKYFQPNVNQNRISQVAFDCVRNILTCCIVCEMWQTECSMHTTYTRMLNVADSQSFQNEQFKTFQVSPENYLN